jgi:hypothetical protein
MANRLAQLGTTCRGLGQHSMSCLNLSASTTLWTRICAKPARWARHLQHARSTCGPPESWWWWRSVKMLNVGWPAGRCSGTPRSHLRRASQWIGGEELAVEWFHWGDAPHRWLRPGHGHLVRCGVRGSRSQGERSADYGFRASLPPRAWVAGRRLRREGNGIRVRGGAEGGLLV